MMGFKGMINGRMFTSALAFIIEARREDGERVPKEALAELMNSLSTYELENNLFTKKEIKALKRIEDFDKTKMYSLRLKSDEDEDDWDEDEDEEDEFEAGAWDATDEAYLQNGCNCPFCEKRRNK